MKSLFSFRFLASVVVLAALVGCTSQPARNCGGPTGTPCGTAKRSYIEGAARQHRPGYLR